MEFLYFLIRRVFWSLLVLFGLSIVIFVIARVMPGDPARMAMGPRASQEQVAELKAKMGLDKPLLEQYEQFVVGLAHGDLGLSLLTKRPVDDDIAETFAATFELVLATIAIAFLFGVPMGVVAAANKDGWIDNLVRFVAILGAVTPSFLLALLLQVLAGYVLHVLPTTGRLSPDAAMRADITGLLTIDTLLKWRPNEFLDALRHLLLPSLALSAATVGQIARITRSSMIDVAKQDYIEAGRAFGVPNRVRVFKYMLRPAFVPPMTILGPGICFPPRQRLRGGAGVRLARHGELRRPQHPAEGPQRRHGGGDDLGRLFRRRQSRRSTCSSASSIRACASGEAARERVRGADFARSGFDRLSELASFQPQPDRGDRLDRS